MTGRSSDRANSMARRITRAFITGRPSSEIATIPAFFIDPRAANSSPLLPFVIAPIGNTFRAGGNYTHMHRTIRDALQPNLRPTGVPTHRAFLYGTWQPVSRLRLTPSLEVAGDRWSEVNPTPAFPYVKTGASSLLDFDATCTLPGSVAISLGFKNLLDEYYELAWGYPQPGRTFYVKTRMAF